MRRATLIACLALAGMNAYPALADSRPDGDSSDTIQMIVLPPSEPGWTPSHAPIIEIDDLRELAHAKQPRLPHDEISWSTMLKHHQQEDEPMRGIVVRLINYVGNDPGVRHIDNAWFADKNWMFYDNRYPESAGHVGVEVSGLTPGSAYVLGCVMESVPSKEPPYVDVSGNEHKIDGAASNLMPGPPEEPARFWVAVLFFADWDRRARIWIRPHPALPYWKWWSCTIGTAD